MEGLRSLMLPLGLALVVCASVPASADGGDATSDGEWRGEADSFGVGVAVLPESTTWDRSLTFRRSFVTVRPSGPDWYGHLDLTYMNNRGQEDGSAYWTAVVGAGFAKTWNQGRACAGIGAVLWFGWELETDSDGSTIQEMNEFALLPEVFVRVPLIWRFGIESTYTLVRETKPMVGGLDVALAFNW